MSSGLAGSICLFEGLVQMGAMIGLLHALMQAFERGCHDDGFHIPELPLRDCATTGVGFENSPETGS